MTSVVSNAAGGIPLQAVPRRVVMKNCPFAGLKTGRRGRKTTKFLMTPPLKSPRGHLSISGISINTWQSTNYQFWRKYRWQPRQASVILPWWRQRQRQPHCVRRRQLHTLIRWSLALWRAMALHSTIDTVVCLCLVGTIHSNATSGGKLARE